MPAPLYIGEDNLLQSDNVRSGTTGALISDGTISAQLKSEDLVTSIGSAVTLAATGTAGQYRGTLPAATTVGLVNDTIYFVVVTLSGTTNGLRLIKCVGANHGAEP